MARRSSPTDLTDDEWYVLEPLIPPAKPGDRPRRMEIRKGVNGIRYLLRFSGAGRLLPHELPKWQTVNVYFRRWQAVGKWERIAGALRRDLRVALGRRPEPTAAILDSQTVKTTE